MDGETQAALEGLVESLPTARLLLLVNYRPEYQHGCGRQSLSQQLRLTPVSRIPPTCSAALLGEISAFRV